MAAWAASVAAASVVSGASLSAVRPAADQQHSIILLYPFTNTQGRVIHVWPVYAERRIPIEWIEGSLVSTLIVRQMTSHGTVGGSS
jgi:hypothetical protein